MHRDKKVGLAMGILLVGIVAAFFFRREPDPLEQLPALDDPEALDRQIAEKAVGPYITGLETDAAADPPAGRSADEPRGRQWDLPDIYADSPADLKAGSLPPTPAAPDPIDLTARPAKPTNERATKPTTKASTSDPAPIHVGSPFGSPESAPTFPANDGWVGVGEPARPSIEPRLEPRRESRRSSEPGRPAEPEPLAVAGPPEAAMTTPPTFTEDACEFYRVRPGDTLSDLALRFLGSSRRYMEIYQANQDKLRSPDDLRADMLIRIPPRNAAPTARTTPPFSGEAAAAPGARFTPIRHAPLTGSRRPE